MMSRRLVAATVVVLVVVGFVGAAGVGPGSTTGWDCEKPLAEGLQPTHGRGVGLSTPAIAFDVMGDGKWVLIRGEGYGKFHGDYWNGEKWIPDPARVKGLGDIGGLSAPALVSNLTGDGKWTLIARNRKGRFFGYYWDGTKWVSDPARVKGLDVIGGRGSLTILDNLKGDGKFTLISGNKEGTFKGYYWDGDKWVSDPSRVAGLGSVGGRSKPAAGFDVFGDRKWTLIAGNIRGDFAGYYWSGKRWITDPKRVKGLGGGSDYGGDAGLGMACNLRGDGKWVLIAGYDLGVNRGYFLDTVSRKEIPQIKGVAVVPFATASGIRWKYEKTWDHRVRYSARKDMSNAVWSDWCKDSASAEVKLYHLKPKTTYYYEAYTYVPWDMDAYAKSSIGSFTTPAGKKHIRLKPGESIQEAIDSLLPEGGIVELLPGVHDVHSTIVINRNNVTIKGTHDSQIRAATTAFVIPHENPVFGEPWHKMPILENFVFRGFKVTSTFKRRRGRKSLILAWNVRNITVEDILDESHLGALIAVNPSGWGSRARGENIFIRNNNTLHSAIVFCFSKNVHVLGNMAGSTIDINHANSYVYIKNNTIRGKYEMNIRAHSGRHVWIEGNRLLGGVRTGIFIDGVTHLTITNNIITGCSSAAIQVDPQPPLRIKIINNLIYNNPGSGIITTEHRGHKNSVVDLTNNVICNNGGHGIDMKVNWVQFKNIANNIITGNKGYGINYIKTFEPTIIKYNNVWNNTKGNYNNTSPGTGDISADPLFADSSKRNFHLKSKAGRWDPKAGKWVMDKAHSPCIDAGDPKAECSREPAPNGGRVNMGAYGNTKEASKSG